MTRFSEALKLSMEEAAWKHFECEPVLSGRDRNDPRRAKKREKVSEATEQFFDALNSDNPPKSREEVISLALGFLGRLIVYLIPGAAPFVLSVQVFIWLWDRMHGEHETGSVVHTSHG